MSYADLNLVYIITASKLTTSTNNEFNATVIFPFIRTNRNVLILLKIERYNIIHVDI